jgi:hypothetical protein
MDAEIIVYKVCTDWGTGPVSWCTPVVPGAPGVEYGIGKKTTPVPLAKDTPLMAFSSEKLARKFINMIVPIGNSRLYRASAKLFDLPVPDFLDNIPTATLFAIKFWEKVAVGVHGNSIRTPAGTVLCSEITLVEEIEVDS